MFGTSVFMGSREGVKYLYKTMLITNIARRKRGTMNVQKRSFILASRGRCYNSLEGEGGAQMGCEDLRDKK